MNPPPGIAGPDGHPLDPGDIDALVDAVFEYAFPLFAVAQTRHRAVADPTNPSRHEPNTVQHLRQLSDHRSRWITAPNNDTLYSNAWIDLSGGPVILHVAPLPAGRYWSLAFMDAFTNHFAIVGQRTHGAGPVALTLLGPGQAAGDEGSEVIHAPGHDVWLFARWLVDGPDDLPQAHAMQDALSVHAVVPGRGSAAPRPPPAEPLQARNFLAVVNDALARNTPPAADQPDLARWRAVGLHDPFMNGEPVAGGPWLLSAADPWDTLSEPVRRSWTTRLGTLTERLRQAGTRGRRDFQGWIAAASVIGDFGRNHALRASVALGGLGALPPSEAMYFVRYADERGEPLHGQHRYVLRVPAGGVPTEAFWSFSMYAATADGRRVFVENPLGRYAIGNRTPGLVQAADGSLEIALQHRPPVEEPWHANWLPAPAGPFQIALRAYLPRAELREGRAPMPLIERRHHAGLPDTAGRPPGPP